MRTFIILLVAGLVGISGLTAQKNTIEEVKIKTSAQCDMCKTRIEEGLYTQKGVVEAKLDVPTKILTIKFRPAKVTVDQLKTYVSSLGYDADDILANQEAHDQLPGCCQKNSTEHK